MGVLRPVPRATGWHESYMGLYQTDKAGYHWPPFNGGSPRALQCKPCGGSNCMAAAYDHPGNILFKTFLKSAWSSLAMGEFAFWRAQRHPWPPVIESGLERGRKVPELSDHLGFRHKARLRCNTATSPALPCGFCNSPLRWLPMQFLEHSAKDRLPGCK